MPQLNFAVADSEAIRDAYSKIGKTEAFKDEQDELKTNPTTTDVRKALLDLARISSPNDTIVIYFAGMGYPTNRIVSGLPEYIFAFADSTFADSTLNTPATIENGISSIELAQTLLQIPAKRQTIILDCQQSSEALQALDAALNADKYIKLTQSSRLFALLGVDGPSYETSELGHGVMTYAILQGLGGDADANHDGIITEAELEGYLTWKIPDITKTDSLGSGEQFASYSTLRDMTLEILPKDTTDVKRSASRVVTPPSPPPDEMGRGSDYALIFATDEYDDNADWPKLNNAILDANTLSKELTQNYGFKVAEVHTNWTLRQVYDTLQEWHDESKHPFKPEDRLFLYFAGHGDFDPKTELGFLVAKNSESLNSDSVHLSYFSFAILRALVDGMPAKHVLVMIDACYAGGFDRHDRTTVTLADASGTLQPLDVLVGRRMAEKSRFYIASTTLRAVADGVPGQHSPFARGFLQLLRHYGGGKEFIDMGMIESQLDYALKEEPKYGPFDPNKPSGDFLFIPTMNPVPVPDPSLPITQVIGTQLRTLSKLAPEGRTVAAQ